MGTVNATPVTDDDLRAKVVAAQEAGAAYEDSKALMHDDKQRAIVDEVYGNANGQRPPDDFSPPSPPTEDMPSMVSSKEIEVPDSIASEVSFETVSLSGSDNPVRDFQEIKQELLTTGKSDKAKAVRETLAATQGELQNEILFNIVNSEPDMSLEDKIAVINEHNKKSVLDVDTQLASMEQLAVNATPPTDPQAQEVYLNLFERLAEQRAIDDDIMHEAEMLGATLDGGVALAFKNLMVSVAPFSSTRVINGIMNDIMPDEKQFWQWALPGEVISDAKDHLASLPPEEQKAFAETILAAIDANANATNGGDFMKFMMIHEFFKETENSTLREGVDWDRVLENITPILDLSVVYGVAKNTFKLLKGLKASSPAATLLAGDRVLASKLLAQGLGDKEVAAALGVTQEELVHTLTLPKPLGHSGDINTAEKAPVVPTNFADEVAALDTQLAEVPAMGETMPLINLTPHEVDTAVSTYRKVLENYDGAAIHNTSLEVGVGGVNGEQLIARGVWGLDGTVGFPSGTQAWEQAVHMFGAQAKFTIMRMYGDRMIKAKNLNAKGEFFIQHESARSFDSMDTLLFGTEDQAVIYMGGKSAGYRGDVSAIAGPEISNAQLSMHDRGKGLNAFMNNLMSPFLALPAKSRLKVLDLIEKGSDEGVSYTFPMMHEAGLTQKEQIGMYSWYTASDAMYILNNQRLRRQLVSDGNHYVTSSSSNFKGIAKNHPVDYNIKAAYNPETGLIDNLNAAKIKTIHDEGGTIMRLTHARYTNEARDVASDFVIIKQQSKTTVSDVPLQPLKYTKGYNARNYKDLYFIDEVRPITLNGVGGIKRPRAVHTAGSMTEALRIAKKMEGAAEEGADLQYIPRRAAELNDTDRAAALFDVEVARGRAIFSERGDRLFTSGGESRILDPMDSMQRAIAQTSKAVSHEPYVNSMKQRWINTYGDLMKEQTGKFPTKFEMREGMDLRKKTKIGKAQAAHDLIRIVDGTPDEAARQWKTAMMWLAEKWSTENKLWGVFGKIAQNRADKDLTGTAKGTSFNLFLVLNPFRQLPLQAQQFMFVSPLAPVYTATKLAPHSLGLNIGMAARAGSYGGVLHKSSNALLKLGAKIAMMNMDEYMDMLQSFKQSGMANAVDSNIFAADALTHASGDIARSALVRGLTHVVNMPKTAFKVAKAVGFDFGEYLNVSNSYLIARHKYIKDSGKSWDKLTKLDHDKIGATTRQYTLGMTEAGRYQYQKGYVSMMTQFLSIQQKAMMAVLPKAIGGNKVFNGWEKAQIGAGQAIFFGAGAWGLSEAYESARDSLGYNSDPVVDAIVTGGLVDTTLYALFGDRNITLAEDFAAGGGFTGTAKNIFMALITNDWEAGELFFGPSAQAAGKIKNAVGLAWDTLSIPLMEGNTLGVQNNVWLAVKELAKISGGYNNYAKGRMIMNLGYFVNRQNDPILTASYEEAVAQIAGFGSDAPNNLYEFKEDIPSNRSAAGYQAALTEDYIQTTAQNYYDRVKAVVNEEISYGDGPIGSLDEVYTARLKAGIRAESLILALQDENSQYLILNAFRKLLAKGVENNTDTLVNQIINKSINGNYGPDTEDLLKSLGNSTFITDKQREQVRETYDYLTKEK